MKGLLEIDLSDDSSFKNGFPHAFFTWLRRNDPMYWHNPSPVTPDGEGFWVISRYADVNKVIMEPQIFSSDKAGPREGGGTAIKDEKTAGHLLNQTDDPYHRKLRNLVNKGFTVKAVNELEDELRTRANNLISSLKPGETFNFVSRISREIPTQAICIVLGVPEEHRIKLCDWVDRGIETDSDSVIATEYLKKVGRYAQSLIEEKRQHPAKDILSTIVHAKFEEDGSALTDRELRSFFALLFPAGAETTTRAISGGMLALLENPTQWQKLRGNPDYLKTGVEEIVRWTTPSVYKRRTATRDIKFLEKNVKEGDKITFWEMSANRDENVFSQPFDFNISRTPNKHIGFGAGVHFCLGAALARLELKIIFESLIQSNIDFELVDSVQWVPNNRLVGLKNLPVKVIARSN